MRSNQEIVFKLEYGGLGDHLFYSALPRILKERKLADKVYLSSQSNFRNPQIFDLIWKNNPHLDGLSDQEPTPVSEIAQTSETKIVNIIFEKYGITAGDEIPVEIYPALEVIPDLRGDYIDLNYVSFVGAFSWFDKIRLYCQYPNHVMINPDRLSSLLFPKRKKIFTKSLLEYAHLINASTSFITLASGGATLAAALKKPAIIYYGYGQNPIFHHGMHQYIRVGGSHLLRRRLARCIDKRNARRLKRSQHK